MYFSAKIDKNSHSYKSATAETTTKDVRNETFTYLCVWDSAMLKKRLRKIETENLEESIEVFLVSKIMHSPILAVIKRYTFKGEIFEYILYDFKAIKISDNYYLVIE